MSSSSVPPAALGGLFVSHKIRASDKLLSLGTTNVKPHGVCYLRDSRLHPSPLGLDRPLPPHSLPPRPSQPVLTIYILKARSMLEPE